MRLSKDEPMLSPRSAEALPGVKENEHMLNNAIISKEPSPVHSHHVGNIASIHTGPFVVFSISGNVSPDDVTHACNRSLSVAQLVFAVA